MYKGEKTVVFLKDVYLGFHFLSPGLFLYTTQNVSK